MEAALSLICRWLWIKGWRWWRSKLEGELAEASGYDWAAAFHIVPHPPGPGLGLQLPSVKMPVCGPWLGSGLQLGLGVGLGLGLGLGLRLGFSARLGARAKGAG